jgi:hypothetical protein
MNLVQGRIEYGLEGQETMKIGYICIEATDWPLHLFIM